MEYLSRRLEKRAARTRGGDPPRGALAASQRERILAAAERAVAEKGCAGATIEGIVKLAGVSTVTFYEHFGDKEECFLAAYEMIDAHAGAAMLAAAGPDEPWPERVRARLAALLDLLSRDPAVARFYLAEPLAAGGEIAARYRDAMQLLAELLRPDSGPSGVDAGGAAHLPELLPELTELALGAPPGPQRGPALGSEPRRVAALAPRRRLHRVSLGTLFLLFRN